MNNASNDIRAERLKKIRELATQRRHRRLGADESEGWESNEESEEESEEEEHEQRPALDSHDFKHGSTPHLEPEHH